MSVLTLSNTDEIYAHSAGARFTQHRIAHPALQNFSFGLRRLLRELGEEATQDEHWRNFTRLLKRYRFEASVAPVGFGHPRLLPPETKEALERAAWRSRMLYPQYAELCEQLVAAIVELAARNDNPLLACLNEIVPADVPLTIALKESRHILWLKEVLQNEGLDDRFLVVSEAQLRGGVCFDALACIGARQWYAPYVWRAPRARQIHWLRFAWISEQTTDAPLLHGWATVQTALRQRPQSRAGFSTPVPVNIVTHGAEADETFDADELVPRIDLTQVAHNYARHVAAEDQTHEMVAARLVQLEGRRGVFLDAEENGTVLIIDLDEDGKDRVRRVATNSIAPEIYVLLRENAGGDYLIPVADKILGARAARLRKFQRLWKERLRALVHREGEYSVIAQLKQCGAVRANETNLRNWLSEKNIRTADEHDFAALMQLVGLSAEAKKCWDMAGEIARAHHRAGMLVRRTLLRQVHAADLDELEQCGEMCFELTELGGSPLWALRVVRVASEKISLPLRQTGKMFDLEDTLELV